MNIINNSKILGLAMACLILIGCGKSEEEKILAKAQSDAGAVIQDMPDCEQRDAKTLAYLNGRGCTKDEWKAFRKQRGW